MGSMALSAFMMFTPAAVNFIFMAILCVGFFGIYIPYQESKKKGEVWAPLRWLKKITAPRDKARRRGPSRAEFDHISSIGPDERRWLEQLETLKDAGLLSQREYKERRDKITKEL